MKTESPFRRSFNFLLILLTLKIGLYLTLFDSDLFNQTFKLFGRIFIDFILVFYLVIKCRFSLLSLTSHLRRTGSLVFYILFLTLGFTSIIWSTNPIFSLKHFFMVVESFVFSALFISVLFHDQKNKVYDFNIESILVLSITLICLFFLLGAFFNPDLFYRGMRGGEEQRLGGYMMNPNELGMLSNIALGLGLTRTFRKLDLKSILIIVINAFVLFETGSRSSVIGLLVMIVFLLFYLGKPRHFLLYGIAAIVPSYLLVEKIILKTGVEEVLSMNGRIPFWEALINESFSLRPILGNGFMRIAESDYFISFETYSGAMAHNTFIQVLLGLGTIGLILVLIQFLLTLRNAYIHLRSQIFIISIIIPVVVNSMTEFGIYGMSNYGVLFWQILVIYLVIDWPQIKFSNDNLNLDWKVETI